jgi:hypothetical protein
VSLLAIQPLMVAVGTGKLGLSGRGTGVTAPAATTTGASPALPVLPGIGGTLPPPSHAPTARSITAVAVHKPILRMVPAFHRRALRWRARE